LSIQVVFQLNIERNKEVLEMKTNRFQGIPYHLWNPFTKMDWFEQFFGTGPTIIVRGEGNYIFDSHGERYINGNSGVWNMGLGYGREELVEAAAKQLRELPFSSCWTGAHPRAIELANKLVEITNGYYDRVYLGANGSEAVETS
jgi:adenosylmethionine-8-amino-7-oxononanoate aminotransferase